MGSLFDGIGVFPLSASRFGISPTWASEIEKAAISITKRHFPNMLHFGDITKVNGEEIPPVSYHYIWFTLSELIQYR
ncbi:DNA cytosine methyltransferase [Oceanobacillus profundus]|uniref:DNA cytosine methyltransferase n=1 Tax=Oceanobacillus profundus TaxID=372463 RepID=UPI00362C50D4